MKTKNVTFSIPQELLDKYRLYAKEKYIKSINSAVRNAMEEYARKIEKEKLYREMEEASKDPLFMSDLVEMMKDFEYVDREAAGGISEW